MTTKNFTLAVNPELLQSNFDGYKLSLDNISTQAIQLPSPPEHVCLSQKQYSFQHVKAFGCMNLLFGDPWHENNVYYIDKRWKVQKVSFNSDEPLTVLPLPTSCATHPTCERVNVSLVFCSSHRAFLCTGTGALLVIDTFDRTEPLLWKISKTLDVRDYGDSPCSVVHSIEYEEEGVTKLACVLLFVKERAKEEELSSGGFASVLHWLSLCPDANGLWEVNSQRTFEGSSTPDYAALELDNSAIHIASEKPVNCVSGSTESLSEIATEMEPIYLWSQNEEEVNLQFILLMPVKKNDVEFVLSLRSIRVSVSGAELLSGSLVADVDPQGSTWTLSDKTLDVTLAKKVAQNWHAVVEGDVRGRMVLDQGDACGLEMLSEFGDGKPVYNVQQLEECDAYPDEASVLLRFDTNHLTHKVNLGSHKWLLNCQSDPELMPCICLRHDVDGLVWRPVSTNETEQCPWQHVATFNAFGFVQASKQQRKFSCCSPDFSFAAICDDSRHIYVYKQPTIISPIRNRKTGQTVSSIAKQHLISLQCTDSIVGLIASKDFIFILTSKDLTCVKII